MPKKRKSVQLSRFYHGVYLTLLTNHHYSFVCLLGVTRPTTIWERIENRLYINFMLSKAPKSLFSYLVNITTCGFKLEVQSKTNVRLIMRSNICCSKLFVRTGPSSEYTKENEMLIKMYRWCGARLN